MGGDGDLRTHAGDFAELSEFAYAVERGPEPEAQVLALAANLRSAYAAYFAAVRETPLANVRLICAGRTLASHLGRGDT